MSVVFASFYFPHSLSSLPFFFCPHALLQYILLYASDDDDDELFINLI